MAEQERTALLDSGTFTHRVDDRQPIAYETGGLKYEGPCREWGSETMLTKKTEYLYALHGPVLNLN